MCIQHQQPRYHSDGACYEGDCLGSRKSICLECPVCEVVEGTAINAESSVAAVDGEGKTSLKVKLAHAVLYCSTTVCSQSNSHGESILLACSSCGSSSERSKCKCNNEYDCNNFLVHCFSPLEPIPS